FIVAASASGVRTTRSSLPLKPEQICLVAAAERQSERSKLFLAVELEAARKARGARRGQTRCPDISAWACRRASVRKSLTRSSRKLRPAVCHDLRCCARTIGRLSTRQAKPAKRRIA